jgi:hypothetical protein
MKKPFFGRAFFLNLEGIIDVICNKVYIKINYMNKLYFLSFIGVLSFVTLSSTELNDNGKAGATGSPGESTCNQSGCHTGVAVNSQGGDLTFDIPGMTNWEYTPGQTYTVNVTMAQSGRNLFGIGLECLQANGDNAGTLVPGTGTQIQNKTVGGFSRKNIVHTENGGASPNSHTFSFSWTAPSSDIGDVTFYMACNAANANGVSSGDHIYSFSQVVTPGAVGVSEQLDIQNLEVYPNPFVNQIRLNYFLKQSGQMNIALFDVAGRQVETLVNENQFSGNHSLEYDLAHLNGGQYIMHMSLNGRVLATQLIQK